jgi:hypothetical protein
MLPTSCYQCTTTILYPGRLPNGWKKLLTLVDLAFLVLPILQVDPGFGYAFRRVSLLR